MLPLNSPTTYIQMVMDSNPGLVLFTLFGYSKRGVIERLSACIKGAVLRSGSRWRSDLEQLSGDLEEEIINFDDLFSRSV